MSILMLGLVVIGAFLIQAALSMLQMKHFSNEFVKLRRQGKVACGRKSGGFHAGAIVMFLIDEQGIVREGRKLEGVTCFARVKRLDGYEGRFIGSLRKEDGPKGHRNLCRAIEDAALTYNKYVAGEVIEEPAAPITKIGRSAKDLLKRSVAQKQYAGTADN